MNHVAKFDKTHCFEIWHQMGKEAKMWHAFALYEKRGGMCVGGNLTVWQTFPSSIPHTPFATFSRCHALGRPTRNKKLHWFIRPSSCLNSSFVFQANPLVFVLLAPPSDSASFCWWLVQRCSQKPRGKQWATVPWRIKAKAQFLLDKMSPRAYKGGRLLAVKCFD